MESYFVINYIVSSSQIKILNKQFNEFNNSCLRLGYNSFAFNQIMNLYMKPEWPIVQTDSSKVQNLIFDTMYYIDSKVQTEHARNALYNTDSYIKIYDEVMFGDICEILAGQLKIVTLATCINYEKGLSQRGFSVLLVRFFQ